MLARILKRSLDYSENSGLDSAEAFLSDLDAILKRIAQFPEIGRKRDELYPDLRSIPYKKRYIIFYRLQKTS
ncbi:MAG: type II toxin-antitoxin system RelE/ParE family toxin [Cyanobacteria bacterium P01_F01_bin.150]